VKLLYGIFVCLLVVSSVFASAKQNNLTKAEATALINLTQESLYEAAHAGDAIDCVPCKEQIEKERKSGAACSGLLYKILTVKPKQEKGPSLAVNASYTVDAKPTPPPKQYDPRVWAIVNDPSVKPEDRLDPDFVQELLESGAASILPNDKFKQFYKNAGDSSFVGRPDGQFIITGKRMKELEDESGKDPAKMEKLLAILPKGAWTSQEAQPLLKVEIIDAIDFKPTMPTKEMSGSNDNYVPNGKVKYPGTGRDVNECVLFEVPKKRIRIVDFKTGVEVYPNPPKNGATK